MKNSGALQKGLLIGITLLGWFGLVGQFIVFYKLGRFSIPELILQYFTFFTVLSNVLVTLTATLLLFRAQSFFSRQTVHTALCGYIFIVALIYNTVLRFLWAPVGIHRVVDELLHVIVPALFILYWAVYSTKEKLNWSSIFQWLLFPLGYMLWVFSQGYFSGFYPYPFLDLTQLSVVEVAMNCVKITLLFVVALSVFVLIGNLLVKYRKSES